MRFDRTVEKLKRILGSRIVSFLLIIPRYVISLAFSILYCLFYGLRILFSGHVLHGIFGLIAMIAGIVFLAAWKPVIVLAFAGLIIAAELIIAAFVYQVLKEEWDKWLNNDYRRRSSAGGKSRSDIPFFEGMTPLEAKNEFRRLMKLYHPDNPGGDLEMSKKVVVAYNLFCKENGIK